MSASNEWTIYHLTPRGWETGTEKTDFNRTERPNPEDRVQSVQVKDFMSSPFSGIDHTRSVIWEADDKEAIAKLKEKFGDAPDYA